VRVSDADPMRSCGSGGQFRTPIFPNPAPLPCSHEMV
jgi:hypothetical protein